MILGWCFIGFRTAEQAKRALQEMNGTSVSGRKLDIRPKENKQQQQRHVEEPREPVPDKVTEERRLFVYGLSPEMDEAFVRREFGRYGVVKEVYIKRTPENVSKCNV